MSNKPVLKEVTLVLTPDELYELYNAIIQKYNGPHTLEYKSICEKLFEIDKRIEAVRELKDEF